ncbi:kinase-like domain-containing protein [Zychaea mexicana]|uniref:kinase-like domain-containing protein n=1 Tax=Zychaea mexicana TaxID=64656 RepID=UPI0022FDE2A9|nr:kinase-like domain-containing protein [Zychaea mexicana]KAI9496405.1 kinase-like domain-containing protein [Zychaea mexicana]
MDLMGPSLESLFEMCDKSFSLRTVSILGLQLLRRLKFIHSKGILHRDIKPDNIVMGVDGDENKVYLIDFGLSKRFMVGGKHGKSSCSNDFLLLFVIYFVSTTDNLTCVDIEQSVRSDLEALGYVLLYLMTGMLPWYGLSVEKLMKNKEQLGDDVDTMCKGAPAALAEYFAYLFELDFGPKPVYRKLSQYVAQMASKDEKNEQQHEFEWLVCFNSSFSLILFLCSTFGAERLRNNPLINILMKC